MDDKKERFSDGIYQIHFIGGLVRIDLMSFEAGEKTEGKPIPVVKERIIMSPDGFLRSFDTMQKLIDQLMEKGIIQKKK